MDIFAFLRRKGKKKDYQRLLSEERERLNAEYNRDLGEMTTTLAHEIRNPLASIRAGAQRIEHKTASADPKIKSDCLKYAQFIIHEVDRLEVRIKGLLQEMRIFTRGQGPDCQLIDLNLLLEEVISSLEDEINRQGIKTVKTFSSPLPKMYLDPQMLKQVFLNLIRNSLDVLEYCKTVNKEIRFSTRINQDYLEVKVADSGPGIVPELREKIFYPFFSNKKNGTGLGLPICQRIIEAHRGKIFLDRGNYSGESNSGAVFVVQLPIEKEIT